MILETESGDRKVGRVMTALTTVCGGRVARVVERGRIPLRGDGRRGWMKQLVLVADRVRRVDGEHGGKEQASAMGAAVEQRADASAVRIVVGS